MHKGWFRGAIRVAKNRKFHWASQWDSCSARLAELVFAYPRRIAFAAPRLAVPHPNRRAV